MATKIDKNPIRLRAMAIRIVSEILDTGLNQSSWKEYREEAYNALLEYRQDMEASVIHVLNKLEEEGEL